MTYEEYINNPLQTRLGGYTREIYRVSYSEKLDKILVRVNNKIDYKLYKNDKDGSYYLYINIPSETVKDFVYDVVVHFVRPNHNVDFDANLDKYDVEFFSNDPAFVYNLEYTFKSRKMFVMDLKSKALPEALRKEPKVTNPNNQLVYCKSLYFAYLIAKQRGLFVKSKYIEQYDRKKLLEQIEDSETKIAKRQELGDKAAKENTKIKKEVQVKRALGNKGSKMVDFNVSNPVFSAKAPEFKNVNNIRAPKSGGKVNFNKSKKV